MSIERRTIIKSAAWGLPVIAAAVATPLASASRPSAEPTGIRFIGVAATKREVKLKIQNIGSTSARNVALLVNGTLHKVWPELVGHQPTEQVRIPRTEGQSIVLLAQADGIESIMKEIP